MVLAGTREAGPISEPLLPVFRNCVRIACMEARNEERVDWAYSSETLAEALNSRPP